VKFPIVESAKLSVVVETLAKEFELKPSRIMKALRQGQLRSVAKNVSADRAAANLILEARTEQRKLEALRVQQQREAERLERKRRAAELAEARRAKKRAAPVRERTSGKPARTYESQLAPQLTRVTLGEEQLWIAEGLERYQAEMMESHGVKLGLTTIARNALKSVLIDGKLRMEGVGIPNGTVDWIGPARLPQPFSGLPAAIAKAAKKHCVTEAEIMRSALAQWVRERGYDKPAKKRR